MRSPHRPQGFTLIELVIVILILGILAAAAIPKFISLQREARIANVDSMYNALRSGSTIVFAKMAATGLHANAAACVNLDTGATGATATAEPCNPALTRVSTAYGYPQNATDAGANLRPLLDEPGSRWTFTAAGAVFDGIVLACPAAPAEPTGCGVCYAQAAEAGQRPVIRRAISAC